MQILVTSDTHPGLAKEPNLRGLSARPTEPLGNSRREEYFTSLLAFLLPRAVLPNSSHFFAAGVE